MKIKVNKHKLNIHYRGSPAPWGSWTQQHAYCLRYAHSHQIESHLGKKQPQAKIAIAFLFGQLHFNNVFGRLFFTFPFPFLTFWFSILHFVFRLRFRFLFFLLFHFCFSLFYFYRSISFYFSVFVFAFKLYNENQN